MRKYSTLRKFKNLKCARGGIDWPCAQRWARWWLSPAPLQGFEFEATFLLSAAMFTMAGALPVLPGPCQLLWWTHINKLEGPIDMYLRHLTLNPQHDGLVKVCIKALTPCVCRLPVCESGQRCFPGTAWLRPGSQVFHAGVQVVTCSIANRCQQSWQRIVSYLLVWSCERRVCKLSGCLARRSTTSQCPCQ